MGSHGLEEPAVVTVPDEEEDRNYVPEEEDEKSRRLGAGCYGMEGGCFQMCNPVHRRHKNVIEYYRVEDRSCWFRLPQIYIRFNPIVTVGAIVIIWGFVYWCLRDPVVAGEEFTIWKTWITEKFTWLYIGSQDFWAILIVMIYFSKYADIKLGKDDEVPEYPDATWFTMLFACGVGIGLFFFGVAEPVWHYDQAGGGNRYIANPYIADNSLAQIAINVTFYHWGIHAWIVYCIVGMLMGLVSYRMGLPMTVKSCFYPLLGDKIFGWMGDLIDIMSIMTTLFGVCTSLGLGTLQLNTGLNLMNESIAISTNNQIIIIWCITAVATASTLSGVGLGIRRLSELCFGVGMVIMLLVFFLDNSWFILNLYIQSIGYYFQWLLQLGFHCDAFEQIGPAHGGEDGRNRDFPDGASDGPQKWMDWWTVFYWGWWISWSPFVGMFIAKISKGRTLRQFINGTMTAPIIYSFFWLTIFGGVGIKMEREAAGVGLCCGPNWSPDYNDTTSYPDQYVGDWMCEGSSCNPCAQSIIALQANLYHINRSQEFYDKMADQKNFGVSLEDNRLTRLSCHTKEEMWFDVMNSYGDLSGLLSVFSLFGIILYFVTSSDSGSFVIDCLAANGDKEPPRIQRVFWALTEGATATALLKAGGSDALVALQTVSVAAGMPYTIILCFMCISLWRALQVDGRDLDNYGPQFAVGIFSVLSSPSPKGIFMVLINVGLAPYSFAKAFAHTEEDKTKRQLQQGTYMIILFLLFGGFIIFLVANALWVNDVWAVGWVCYIAFASAGGSARIGIREKYNINGNMIEDLCCGIFCYPFLAYQLTETISYYNRRVKQGLDITHRPMEKQKK